MFIINRFLENIFVKVFFFYFGMGWLIYLISSIFDKDEIGKIDSVVLVTLLILSLSQLAYILKDKTPKQNSR